MNKKEKTSLIKELKSITISTNEETYIVIDGPNTLYYTFKKILDINRVFAVYDFFSQLSKNVFIFMPGYIRNKLSNKEQYDEYVEKEIILEIPWGKYEDDVYLLESANQNNGYVVSNDCFREYHTKYPELIPQRVINFMIIKRQSTYKIIIPQLIQNQLTDEQNYSVDEIKIGSLPNTI